MKSSIRLIPDPHSLCAPEACLVAVRTRIPQGLGLDERNRGSRRIGSRPLRVGMDLCALPTLGRGMRVPALRHDCPPGLGVLSRQIERTTTDTRSPTRGKRPVERLDAWHERGRIHAWHLACRPDRQTSSSPVIPILLEPCHSDTQAWTVPRQRAPRHGDQPSWRGPRRKPLHLDDLWTTLSACHGVKSTPFVIALGVDSRTRV